MNFKSMNLIKIFTSSAHSSSSSILDVVYPKPKRDIVHGFDLYTVVTVRIDGFQRWTQKKIVMCKVWQVGEYEVYFRN